MKGRLIGIGGLSRSGKSTLARQLSEKLPDSAVFSQDDFVKDEALIPKVRDRTDWEHPDSLETEKFVSALKKGLNKHAIVIAEGLLIFQPVELRSLIDFKILIEIRRDTFDARRKVETRWGPEPAWYRDHVWDSYLKFGQLENPDLRLSGVSNWSHEELNEIVHLVKQ